MKIKYTYDLFPNVVVHCINIYAEHRIFPSSRSLVRMDEVPLLVKAIKHRVVRNPIDIHTMYMEPEIVQELWYVRRPSQEVQTSE